MHLPAPLRAAVGLAATAAAEVKRLPDRAIELPMLAVSTALQASLRAQQRYAYLASVGDQVLGRGRATDEPPGWATFDEPVSAEELHRTTLLQEREAALAGGVPDAVGAFPAESDDDSPADTPEALAAVPTADTLTDATAAATTDTSPTSVDPAAVDAAATTPDPPAASATDEASPAGSDAPASGTSASRTTTPRTTTAQKTTARKTTAKKTTARKTTAKKTTAKKTTAKKTAAKKTAAKKATTRPSAADASATGPAEAPTAPKKINAPRNQRPSAFDRASDDDGE